MTVQTLLVVACVPLLAAFIIACFRDPLRYALPPYVILVPFSSLLSVAPGPLGSVSSLLGLLLGTALLAQLITHRRGAPSVYAALPVWLGFLGLCGLSLLWSIAPRASAEDFLTLAAQVLLFVALVLTRVDARELRRFENAVVLSGVLVTGYGLAQLLLGQLPNGGSGSGRFGEDLLGANNQAAALLLPLALLAHRAVVSRGDRLLNALLTVLLLFGVLMTGSRGGLVSAAAVLLVVVTLGGVRRITGAAVAAAGAVVVSVVLLLNPLGVGERQVNQAESSSGRSEIWTVGLYSCPEYCLEGAGWGTFPEVYRQELASVPDARILAQGTSYEPHNIFLLALVELGVLGLALLVLGLVIPLVDTARMPRQLRGPPLAALIGTVISSFFLSNLEFKFFWLVLAYVALASLAPAAERAGPAATRLPANAGTTTLTPGRR